MTRYYQTEAKREISIRKCSREHFFTGDTRLRIPERKK